MEKFRHFSPHPWIHANEAALHPVSRQRDAQDFEFGDHIAIGIHQLLPTNSAHGLRTLALEKVKYRGLAWARLDRADAIILDPKLDAVLQKFRRIVDEFAWIDRVFTRIDRVFTRIDRVFTRVDRVFANSRLEEHQQQPENGGLSLHLETYHLNCATALRLMSQTPDPASPPPHTPRSRNGSRFPRSSRRGKTADCTSARRSCDTAGLAHRTSSSG